MKPYCQDASLIKDVIIYIDGSELKITFECLKGIASWICTAQSAFDGMQRRSDKVEEMAQKILAMAKEKKNAGDLPIPSQGDISSSDFFSREIPPTDPGRKQEEGDVCSTGESPRPL